MTLKAKNIPIKRWGDIWIALGALTAICLVGARLWATDWTRDLYILVYLAFFAGLSGLALGYSRFSPLLATLFSILYGIFITGWLFGTTVETDMTWRNRILNYLGFRLRLTIEQYLNGNPLSDPILFLTLMALLLWVIGSVSAFIIIRRGAVWPALIPLGLALLVFGQYDQDLARNTRFLMTFVLLSLLILGRMTFLRNKQKWQQEGIQTTTEIHADLNRTLLIAAAFLLVLAWIIPITPQQVDRYSELWQTIKEPWDRFTDQISDIFVVDQAPTTISSGFYGESLDLGNGIPASEDLVFTVEVITPPPPGYRNYWRTRSYDTYEDQDWSSSPGLIETQLFPDDLSLPYPDWEGAEAAAYAFTASQRRTPNLYAPGLPTAINRPVEALTQILPEEERDLVALLADPNWVEGETYQVETLVRLPSEAELMESGSEYPEWTTRYLQLPDDFSSEVADLAAEIARGQDNPFDIAYAITRYLRINIEYSRTLPPVPAGRDPMEWFLFEEKRGFCNYYATAQVLMLRSLGIPARIAVGYAAGEYDPQMETFTIRRQDSHAWPEVYFVNYGWVIFEPTASQPAFILPAGFQSSEGEDETGSVENLPQMDAPLLPTEIAAADLEEPATGDNSPTPVFRYRGTRIIWGLIISFLVMLVVAIIVLIRPNYFRLNIDPLPVLLEQAIKTRGKPVPVWVTRWSRLARMSAAEKAYRQIGRSIRLLGQPLNRAETPSERAQTLLGLLPNADEPTNDIIREYNLDQYSNHIISEERAKKAARQIGKLTLKTLLQKLNPIKKTE